MIHFLNEFAVASELDGLEESLSDAHAEGDLNLSAVRVLLAGVRKRLGVRRYAVRPEDDDVDAVAIETFEEPADDAPVGS